MMELILQDASGTVLARAAGQESAALTVERTYVPGDTLTILTAEPYIYASVDACLLPAHLYVPSGRFVYRFPTDPQALEPYHPQAFRSGVHTYMVGKDAAVKKIRRDLALNPLCQHEQGGAWPFAHANVETRGESVFFARNVIDGIHLNNSHGVWPYESWGIGLSETAEITIEFGRKVTVDAMCLTLRADFPHDAYWKQASVTLSDAYSQTFELQMTADGQQIVFDAPHEITSITLHSLVKQVMDSPFPALRSWEVFGIG